MIYLEQFLVWLIMVSLFMGMIISKFDKAAVLAFMCYTLFVATAAWFYYKNKDNRL